MYLEHSELTLLCWTNVAGKEGIKQISKTPNYFLINEWNNTKMLLYPMYLQMFHHIYLPIDIKSKI